MARYNKSDGICHELVNGEPCGKEAKPGRSVCRDHYNESLKKYHRHKKKDTGSEFKRTVHIPEIFDPRNIICNYFYQ